MNPQPCERGFSLIEVLIAVIVLGVGVTALAGGSALVTRQVSRGRSVTIANQLATQKLDSLRFLAALPNGASQRCTNAGFVSGGPSSVRGVALNWSVIGGTMGPNTRDVSVVATYPVRGGTRNITLRTVVGCL